MAGKTVNHRVSGGSFLSDEEFVVIRLGSKEDVEAQLPSKLKANEEESSFSTQIRRITMKKQEQQRKKDSVASIDANRKESLKTPLIVQTLSVDSSMLTSGDEEDPEEDFSHRLRRKSSHFLEPLKQTDLPRSLRSTRRLSACNEQVLMEMQQNFLNGASGSRRSSRRSSSITEGSKNVNDSDKEAEASKKKPSLPTVEERPPIWGQFHFFPNGVDSHLMNNPFPPGHAFPGQAPIVLLPSSYETEKDAEPSTSDGCFNAILLGGSLVLLGTISAAVALIFGFL